jgi:hypothetical protein
MYRQHQHAILRYYNQNYMIEIYLIAAKNPCLANPCKNGGSCKRVGSGFICRCVGGYTGATCERKYCFKIGRKHRRVGVACTWRGVLDTTLCDKV